MKKMKKLFLGALALVMMFTLAACGNSEKTEGSGSGAESDGVQEITIKIAHVVAENTPKHQGALKMKEVIEKESDGKIKVQVYPNSSLFGDKDEYQNLVANNVQFILPDMSKLVGNDPGFNIPAMPFLFESDEAANAFWDGEKGQEIFKRLEKDGVLGMAMWPNGAKHMTNDKKAIKKPGDLDGMKIRTQGGQLLEAIYAELGAGSASIPFGELYTALQQGTVDGQENTFSNIESKKFDEVQKYMTIMGHTRVDYALLTNTKFWEGLNDETKAIVQKGVDEGTKLARESAKKLNDDALAKLKDNGQVEINELSDTEIEEFKKTLEPIYNEWAEKIGKDIIEDAESK
ncbi:DctP family TRAP transporter solute-binding subunit [Cytobacillus oceanisediminis]|uniref:DctP family TRAP transporter solute-binding subunit n=1 Tax=Cytobacillus oceanisediminis TaxID=665099 RepID=UPI002550145D|nr:DctP family TRAP transporter solute-binding subunit [Cytobacillus oceanisediminis]MDK7665952.1 DctP family TRAP transporter solute-binding subunit [Cytobacillus oceanisediminis]